MALLGQSINPALFLQDYSGFAKAGAIQAQGMQNLGQQIQQAAGDYAANKKEAGKLSGIKKAGIADIEAAIKLSESSGLGLESSLQPLLAAANDPNSSLMEQAAVAQQGSSSIANLLNTRFKVEEMNMQRQAAAQSGAMNAAKMQEMERHNIAMESKGTSESYQIKPTRVDVGGNTYELDVLFDPKTGNRYDPDTKTQIGDITKYASGEPGWEAPVEQPKDTSTSFNASRLSENLKPLASTFEEKGRKYNVSPTFLAAIAELETGGGTSNAFLNKNNVMGVSDEKGPISFGQRAESIERMAKLLGEGINENKGPYAGVQTIQDIGRIYAPVGAENDPRGTNAGWSSGVSSKITELSQPNQPVISQAGTSAEGVPQAEQKTNVRPGAVRIQSAEGFREATPEEILNKYGRPGQIDTKSNRFYPYEMEKGTQVVVSPEGGVTFTQGAGVGQTKAEAAKEVQKQQKEDRTKAFIDTTSGIIGKVEKLKPGVLASAYRKGSAFVAEAGEAGKLESDLSRLRTSISLQTMNEMRSASPTGGAAGNMTVAEWPRFEETYGSLSVGGDPKQLANRLKEASLTLFNGVHGSPEQRSQWLAAGKITPEQNKQVDDMYMEMRNRVKIPKSGIENVSGSALPSDAIDTKLSPRAQENKRKLGL